MEGIQQLECRCKNEQGIGRRNKNTFAIEGDSAQATAATRNIQINTRRLPVDDMGYPATVHVYQVHRTVALACRAAAQD